MNLHDLEKTTPETRKKHADRWDTDWYKVIEDMAHCAHFLMRDELGDLIEDGLQKLGPKLTAEQKAEWEKILQSVREVVFRDSGTPASQLRYMQITRQELLVLAHKMTYLMQSVIDRQE